MASDFSEYFVEQGLFYPPNDLDDPLLEGRKIVIGQGINEQNAKEVVRKLLYLNSKDPSLEIDLYVSTQGGWYDSAFTIIDTFNVISAPVNTICIGGCYSAGAMIVAAGTGKRVAYSHALFSIHIAYNSQDLDMPYANRPDRVNAFLLDKAKLPEKWFPLEDDRSYYLSAVQAKEFALIDKVLQ